MQGGRAPTVFPLRRVSSVFPELAEVGLRSGLVKWLRQIQSQDETPPAAATPSEAAARVLIRLRRTRMRKTAYCKRKAAIFAPTAPTDTNQAQVAKSA